MSKTIYKIIDKVEDIVPQGTDSGSTAVLIYGINVITSATTNDADTCP
jgi:hypothetical protein